MVTVKRFTLINGCARFEEAIVGAYLSFKDKFRFAYEHVRICVDVMYVPNSFAWRNNVVQFVPSPAIGVYNDMILLARVGVYELLFSFIIKYY